MHDKFVIEAVMVAVHGQLMAPGRPLTYVMPYKTVMELYEMRDSGEWVVPDEDDDRHVKRKIGELIEFFEDPFNRKKLERALVAPWRSSPSLIVSEQVSFVVVNASDQAQFGELFDPVETELILTAMRDDIPLLTDQIEFLDKLIESGIDAQAFDIEDFEFALEGDLSPG